MAFTSGLAENIQTWTYPYKCIENFDRYLTLCGQRELEFESWTYTYNVSDLEQIYYSFKFIICKMKARKQHTWKGLAYTVSIENVCVESYSQFFTRGKNAIYGYQSSQHDVQTSDGLSLIPW